MDNKYKYSYIEDGKYIYISDDDRLYTYKIKLSKIEFIINKFSEKDISKYSCVAFLDNGTDYYFCNNKYIAIVNL